MRIAEPLHSIEKLFLALGDKTRLRILNLMRDHEVSVGLFAEVLGESQPKISRHLAYLRNMEVVEARRDGKRIHYRISDRRAADGGIILDALCQWFDSDETLHRDRERCRELIAAAGGTRDLMPATRREDIYERPHMYSQQDLEKTYTNEIEDFLL